MNDLISRKALIAEYDRVHIGPPGGARKLMEDAPSVNIADVPHWATEQAYKNGYEQGKKDAWKWIPVGERLPDVRVPVLTYGRKGAIGIGFVQPTSVAADGKVYFYARYGDSLPTHWMPLPEPPKEA